MFYINDKIAISSVSFTAKSRVQKFSQFRVQS